MICFMMIDDVSILSKVGKLESWKVGRLEGWKAGRLEGGKAGSLKGWKVECMSFVGQMSISQAMITFPPS